MIRWIIFLVFVIILEIYAFQAFRMLIKSKWFFIFYYVTSAIALTYIVYQLYHFDRSVGQTPKTMMTMGLLLLLYVPKLLLTFILFGEDLVRFISGLFSLATKNTTESFLPERRKFVSQIALGIAAIPFVSLLYGVTLGKYNFKVIKQTLFFPDLPEAFDGTTITHISDVHSGSFDDADKIQYAIDLINEQNSDLVLFTGDIVNTHATEMDPWIEHFSQLDAPHGKFSILGNHDYGDYVQWPSEEAKAKNLQDLKEVHGKIGFRLLLNESFHLEKDGEKIALIGVENWGKRGFVKHGDLDKAIAPIEDSTFKVLLSHDPSHWEAVTVPHEKKVHLTLAGHTHGMQFGIEIPGIKWSPVKYIYPQWAGLYPKEGQYIYVNRGFGFLGFPGRVGILPEITVIELVKG